MQDMKDTTNDVHYENFRAQCISQISQHAMRERTKLKRDSVSSTNGSTISETDRLLLQKDEEVFSKFFYCYVKCQLIISFLLDRYDECKTCSYKCKRN